MRKLFLLFITILSFYSCSTKTDESTSKLISIIESDIINSNNGNSMFPEMRNSDFFTLVDTTNTTYTIDIKKKKMIRFSRKGNELNLTNSQKEDVIKFILEEKSKMDSLEIKSIFPESKHFTIYTYINSDNTKEENEKLLALINFTGSRLNDTLIDEMKNNYSVKPLIKDWFYYEYE